MAITFEEKSNIGRNITVLVILVLLLAGVIFFVWRLLQSAQVDISVEPVNNVQIDKKVLSDPRIASLELFPEIPPATVGDVRQNPFVRYVAPSENKTKPASPSPDDSKTEDSKTEDLKTLPVQP